MTNSICVKTVSQALSALADILIKTEERGERTLVFAEDRLTLLAEKAVCEKLGGSFLSDVTTFSRYLHKKGERVLSKQGSVMKIGELMLKNRAELSCFNKEYSAKTSAKMVYETIAQFAACRIAPKELSSLSLDDVGLDRKIKDIAFLYGEYLDFLDREGFSDENSLLALLPSALEADTALPQTNVIFFAFGSFTHQALEGVRAALYRARSVTGIFLNGEEEFFTGEAETRFLRLAEEFGGAKRRSYPSALSPAQRAVASSLYSAEVYRSDFEKFPARGVYAYECENRFAEAATAAALVKKAVLSGKRYRDISLFVPDVNAYYGDLKRNFDAYGIPCFADVKRPLSTHPVSSFLLSLFEVVDGKCSPSAVNDLVSSVFFGDRGNYCNYLDKFVPFRGGALKPVKPQAVLDKFGFDGEEISSERERLIDLYHLVKPSDTGVGYAKSVREVLARVQAEAVLKALSDEEEDVAMQSFLSQISPALDKILSEISAISGEKRFTAGEFRDILSDGFTAAEISLIPIKSDAVFIGDISSSKVGDSKTVVALGLTSKVPFYSSDVALISDRDIARLKKENVDVAPLISEVNLRSREGVCCNLLSFSEELYLLYPVADGGSENGKSEIFSYLSRGLGLRAEREVDLFPFDSSEFIPAQKKYFLEESALKRDISRPAAAYTAIGNLLEGKLFSSSRAQKRNISLGEELFFGRTGYLSPTLLENFNTCPYKNFAERGLRLKEKEEGLIRFSDSGTFIHEILRGVGERIKAGAITSYESCLSAAEEVGREVLLRPEFLSLEDNPSDRYFAERLLSDGKSIAGEVFRQIEGSGFAIGEVEKKCFLPSLSLSGTIDRIDNGEDSLRVVDYKTGSIKTGLRYYYMGTKLQLELYAASALKNAEDKKLAGVFYFPARVDFSSVKDGESAFAMQGYVSDAALDNANGELSSEVKKVPDGEFPAFLRYAENIALHSRALLKKGYVRPSPCDGACSYCAYKGMCGFDGEERSVPYSRLKSEDIIKIVKEEEDDG